MNWDVALVQDLIDHEGYREKAYKDTLGNYTIGIGHYLGTDPKFSTWVWEPPRIFTTFIEDLSHAESDAQKLIPKFDKHSPNRQRAIINMSFNMGYSTLSQFVNSLRLFNTFKYAEAADNFMLSKWAKQVGNRSRYVTELIRNG